MIDVSYINSVKSESFNTLLSSMVIWTMLCLLQSQHSEVSSQTFVPLISDLPVILCKTMFSFMTFIGFSWSSCSNIYLSKLLNKNVHWYIVLTLSINSDSRMPCCLIIFIRFSMCYSSYFDFSSKEDADKVNDLIAVGSISKSEVS